MNAAGNISLGVCKNIIKDEHLNVDSSTKTFNHFPLAGQPSCFVPAQDSIVCIGSQSTEDILFDQLASYGPRGFSDLLAIIALACLTLYFVTSSDSGSLVVDILSSNGHPEPPVFQRIFWSFTEGATAIALLVSGSNAANATASLKALQSASIICGLPYTFILFYATLALSLAVREEAGTLDPKRKGFSVFIFNFKLWRKHIMNIFAPGIILGRAVAECGKWPGADTFSQPTIKIMWTVIFSGLYYSSILFEILGVVIPNWAVVGGVMFCGFAVLTGLVRYDVRRKFNIQHGDLFTDLICGLFAHEFTLSQIDYQFDNDNDDDTNKKLEDQLVI
jgi:FtsH-binding integral membrane protein